MRNIKQNYRRGTLRLFYFSYQIHREEAALLLAACQLRRGYFVAGIISGDQIDLIIKLQLPARGDGSAFRYNDACWRAGAQGCIKKQSRHAGELEYVECVNAGTAPRPCEQVEAVS